VSGSKYRVTFTNAARSQLRRIDREHAMSILSKLTRLADDPYGLATTALVDSPTERRLRVGNYRVIYSVNESSVTILATEAAHRSVVYRDR
jgi:mRNA interferase RelE/StbE